MYILNSLALMLLSLHGCHATLKARDESPSGSELRLIKIHPEEPAQWVTNDEKDGLKANGVHFFDITGVTDEDFLERINTPLEDSETRVLQARQAIEYPTDVSHQAEANALISLVNNDGPEAWMYNMTEFWNRHYRSVNGTIFAQWMFDMVSELAAPNPLIEVTQFTHAAFDQPSTIARIPGETDDLIVIGAHFDSIAGLPTARAPGADDNASGVVVLLEALRILASTSFTTHNTIEFHFYGGEEGGLLGSREIWSDYNARGLSVLGFVNQDMTGYSPSGMISIFTDYVDLAFTAYVRIVAEAYTGPTSEDRCRSACSDHATAHANGFPAAYVCDEVIRTSSPYIHSIRDTYDTIMWDAILRHSVFTVAFLVEASYLQG